MIAENPNNDQLQLDSLCHSANALKPPPSKIPWAQQLERSNALYIVILMDEKPVEGGGRGYSAPMETKVSLVHNNFLESQAFKIHPSAT